LGLASSFSNEALEHGAELSLEFDRLTYQGLKSFAKNYGYRENNISEAPKRDFSLICLQGGRNE